MSGSGIIEENYTSAVKGLKEDWLNTVSTDWYNYVVSLPSHLNVTYLIVVFHNQVYNGGFHQYFVNGYGQFARETINALKAIGAPRTTDLLLQALNKVNSENLPDEVFRILLLRKELPQLFDNDDLFEPLNDLDKRYYSEESEDVMKVLSDYLKDQSN